MITNQEALDYHSRDRRGKVEIAITKPCSTQRDLSLAYTPGVAEPCRRIQANPDDVFQYTAKGNLVAVVTNGTAVLGLGNIGPAAGKPVMEGKGVLFKRFADIDVFDLELECRDPEEFIRIVRALEPTFGGINLEDIKAPECFRIEEALSASMNIPVFHDDQHGTAIISGAALVNAARLAKKELADLRVVVNGAGAAGIACAKFYVQLGVRKENILLCDSAGVVYHGRKQGMNPYKELFAAATEARTLADALRGADVFAGVSVANVLSQNMVRSMADNPIILAMANPDPEITYPEALAARDDVIMATGRSDFPNQVNNVLGFPFIFRGALDVRATAINDSMKVAAARALADLVHEPVPYSVMKAYRIERLSFGRDYLIPKPFDPRVLIWETTAVARAAMETDVARNRFDVDEYRERLEARLGLSRRVTRTFVNLAKKDPKRIVYPEGDHPSILKACEMILDEGMAHPILLGNPETIRQQAEELHLEIDKGIEILDPAQSDLLEDYAREFYKLRCHKGVTQAEAGRLIRRRNYFGSMMLHLGQADGLVSGLTQSYPETIRPALEILGTRPGVHKVAGLYMMIFRDRFFFFADATVNIEPSAEDLAEIALLCAKEVQRFDVEPRVAMLSFSNFGSSKHPAAAKVRRAVELVKEAAPELIIDGEMQADTAVVEEIIEEVYPFSSLQGGPAANILIFPSLEAGNIAYKLLQNLGGAQALGPILMGMRKPVHVLQIGGYDEIDVVKMTAIAVIDAQASGDGKLP